MRYCSFFHTSQSPVRLLVALLVVALAFLAQPAWARVVDRVVAEVNGEIITMSELEREMAGVEQQVLQQAPAADREQALTEARQQVLSGMIDRLLARQQADRLGIRVGEREVDEAIAQILADNRITMEELEAEIARHHGSMENYRRDLQTQILQSRLLSQEVRERVVIPERRIKEYYQQHHQEQTSPEEAYHILQIGFNWPPGDDEAREQARRQAEEIHRQARQGADFRELARRYSDLPSARNDGDLGVFQKDELAGIMLEHIPELEPGEISTILETAAGYQFFKLLSNQGELRATGSYEELKGKIREKLYQQALEEQFSKWVKELRENDYIRTML